MNNILPFLASVTVLVLALVLRARLKHNWVRIIQHTTVSGDGINIEVYYTAQHFNGLWFVTEMERDDEALRRGVHAYNGPSKFPLFEDAARYLSLKYAKPKANTKVMKASSANSVFVDYDALPSDSDIDEGGKRECKLVKGEGNLAECARETAKRQEHGDE
jgi:hypothetical protein